MIVLEIGGRYNYSHYYNIVNSNRFVMKRNLLFNKTKTKVNGVDKTTDNQKPRYNRIQ